jgi:hypothetical protein
MKHPLHMATLAVGFLAGLGIAAVRGELWHSPAASFEGPAEQALAVPLQAATVPLRAVAAGPVSPAPATDAATPLQPTAPEPAASDPQPDGRESAAALRAPTYDEQTAAHDRAAAHSARSR